MYKLLIVLIITTLVVSCNTVTQVKLKNGAVLPVKDYYAREYKTGDTVCIKQVNLGDWYIESQGHMMDTSYTSADGAIIEMRIGILQKY